MNNNHYATGKQDRPGETELLLFQSNSLETAVMSGIGSELNF